MVAHVHQLLAHQLSISCKMCQAKATHNSQLSHQVWWTVLWVGSAQSKRANLPLNLGHLEATPQAPNSGASSLGSSRRRQGFRLGALNCPIISASHVASAIVVSWNLRCELASSCKPTYKKSPRLPIFVGASRDGNGSSIQTSDARHL